MHLTGFVKLTTHASVLIFNDMDFQPELATVFPTTMPGRFVRVCHLFLVLIWMGSWSCTCCSEESQAIGAWTFVVEGVQVHLTGSLKPADPAQSHVVGLFAGSGGGR